MNDPWFTLKRFTQARIGRGHSGCATPTSAQLEFQLAHAMARDAVHQPWQLESFAEAITAKGWQPLLLSTPISDRRQYLLRPDLGRCLDHASRQCLQTQQASDIDVALIISNGLSSTAIDSHGLALLESVMAAYASCSLNVGPVCLVPNARVALADEIGGLLNARLSVIIVGERPGLSAADSLGVYLTYLPRIGNSDAERNCLSNIRPPQGLSCEAAATKLAYLSTQAIQRGMSGVALKDDMPVNWLETTVPI
ncbi:ethanolamine ammonia-lyase [Methylomonas lenta]|uniref:Ethanolamine ammonia-lyase small subunit n=1 Tax=Methylomonas lenta TaxID=980561 RepID=A0A177MW55_9GAMM|nr:ethanolamine ammonia-lyase subunit EutC [Methylomonas lenta]OAI09936.1 ethanolamine ammonia-lyase [Methylomonas lenta]